MQAHGTRSQPKKDKQATAPAEAKQAVKPVTFPRAADGGILLSEHILDIGYGRATIYETADGRATPLAKAKKAREAAQRGDWDRVDRVVARAKIVARDNVWMKQSLEALEKYSRKRQTQQFSKEALYSADKMNKRLVADDESSISYSQSVEAEKAAYLRRKMERGKRM